METDQLYITISHGDYYTFTRPRLSPQITAKTSYTNTTETADSLQTLCHRTGSLI